LLGETNNYDVIITEIGGTVGDIESLPYIESVRQLRWELGKSNSLVIHLTLVPYLSAAKELKTKPTQHSVKTLMESGINADILVCRTEHDISDDIKNKLALFCNVDVDSVIQSKDASTIYDVPLMMEKEKLDKVVLKKLEISNYSSTNMNVWADFVNKLKSPKNTINIGLVGKYVELQDSYKSILESLVHAGSVNETKVNVHSIHSEHIDDEINEKILKLDGLIVAPGFGSRGIEGKIKSIKSARENNIPFLQIKERHRHRWELNNKYLDDLQDAGLKASGINSKTGLVEIVELPSNDWFIGVQFHPEYKSTVENPHPLFVSFVSACLKYNNSKK